MINISFLDKKTVFLLLFLLFYLVILVWVSAAILDTDSDIGYTFMWLVALHPVLFSLTIGCVIRHYLKFGAWFNTVNFVLVLIYIYFGLGSLYYISYYNDLPHESLKYHTHAVTTFWLVCLGAFSYKIGSIIPSAKYVSRAFPVKVNTPAFSFRVKFGIFLSFVASISIKLSLIDVGAYGFLSYTPPENANNFLTIIRLFEISSSMGVLVGCYYWFSGAKLSKFDKFFIILFVMVLILFAILSGMKAKILHVALLVIIPAIFVGRKEGRTIISTKVYKGLLLLFLSYWIINPGIRLAMVNNQSSDIFQTIYSTANTVLSAEYFSNIGVENSIHTIWERVSLFRYFNSVVAQTGASNGVNYREWDRYPYLPISFIPRLIIPDKPVNNYSAQFNVDYISDVYNSTTPSMFGWAYMESGVASLIILMFFLGFVHKVVDEYCIDYGKLSVFSVIVFSIFFQKMANIEPDPYWIFNGIYQEIFLTLVCYYLFFARFKLNGKSVNFCR